MHTLVEELRRHLHVTQESQRLFHGRGHCFPGFEDLLIDWFNPVVLVSLYALRDENWLQQLVELLQKEVHGLTTVLLQERLIDNGPVRVLLGEQPQQIDAIENGLHYRLRLGTAQNIGFFPDMQKGRALVRSLSAGKKVLNLFSYTCSFSVAALAGDAGQVVNLDMNRGALDLGRLNHQINNFDLRQVSFLSLDILRSFSRLGRLGPFDLVICDPPAYQGKSFKAERDWPKLLRKLPDFLKPGGEVIACLNGPHLPPDFLQELFDTLRPEMELQQRLQPGDNFPENDSNRGVWLFHYRNISG